MTNPANTRNILTIRERRVLKMLFETFKETLAEPHLDLDEQRNIAEIMQVLEQVIDSATIPDEEWRSKYLAKDAEAT